MIDQSRVADGFLFATHRDRCLYLGKSVDDRPRWLRDNVGKWQRIEDVQQEAPPLRPCESKINVGPMPAEPADSSSSPDVRNDGDDEADVPLDGAPTGDCSSAHEPTSLPTPVTAIIKKRTTNTLTIGLAPSVVRPPGAPDPDINARDDAGLPAFKYQTPPKPASFSCSIMLT